VLEQKSKMCANRLFYFSTPPKLFTQISQLLKSSGLLASCQAQGRKLRVLIEKPFGYHTRSAHELNKSLLSCFTEDQIYRIDHYQGKETVQNLIVVRFGNALLEPLWNAKYIDHVEISVLESLGVADRAEFYDATGALSDMLQNHLLQLLALTAMEEPKELKTELIRDEKVKVLSALTMVNKSVVRGQYLGYENEIGHKSQTETFISVKAELSLPRWRGVPFYLRTGKKLGRKITEISIHFKELPKCLFRGCAGNILTFRIQPDEGVYLRINNKIPGFGIELHQTNLEFSYHNTFKREIPSAYERLLLDFLQGDQRLFIRSDEIEAAWKFVDTIRLGWKNSTVVKYKAGSLGPKEADNLIQKDDREWHTV